jgi:peptide/nickel transport system substrate-binding protein
MATASSAYDWQILGRINDSPFAYDAETLEDVPNWVTKATEEVWTYVDDEGNEEPNAAKVTYKMRKDVKWHDGEDFKASDVKFTIEYLRDNKVPRYLGSVNTVVKVETPDDYTVVVYSSTPGFLHLYDIQGLPWLPEHIWKDVTDWKGFQPWKESHPTVEGLTKLIGIGPFVFKEYNPGEYVRLERFEDYWRLKL